MSNKPLILSDNLFDDAVLHSTHLISHTGTPVAGQEVWRVSDNLRDTTSFTIAEANFALTVTVDCGVAQSASCLVLDRGHNLAGKSVVVQASTDNFVTSTVAIKSSTIPTTAGGLGSDANGCTTPEGAWWGSWTAVSYRYWRVTIAAVASFTPVLTGLYLGATYRLPEYPDGPAAYDYRITHRVLKNEMTWAGLRVKRGLRNFGEVNLSVVLEEADFQLFHPHVVTLFAYNAPWWFCLDDSSTEGSGLMRLFQLPGDTTYDPATIVTRSVQMLLEEVYPKATI